MNQTFEKVEKHLYKRQYPTAGGDWSTKFYGIFTCWDKERRTFPLGDSLQDARDELGRLRTLNKGRHDWDGEKKKVEEQKRRAITFSQWGNRYFTDQLSPNALRQTRLTGKNDHSRCWMVFLATCRLWILAGPESSNIERRGELRVSGSSRSIARFHFSANSSTLPPARRIRSLKASPVQGTAAVGNKQRTYRDHRRRGLRRDSLTHETSGTALPYCPL
jgi:hypothetical protein